MYKQHTIDSILAWIDMTDLNIVNVSLVCSEEELRKRIWKDVYAGLRTPDAIEASIEKIKLYSSLCTTKITITNLSPEEAADKIISLSKKNK